MRIALAALALFLVAPESSAAAQNRLPDDNSDALRGVKSVDAIVILDWDVAIRTNGGPDETTLETRAETIFQLELRRAGVVVEESAPNFLICSFNMLYSNGTVVYSASIEFLELVDRVITPSAERDYAITWQSRGVVTVGLNNLTDSVERRARMCAETFLNAFLAANPKT